MHCDHDPFLGFIIWNVGQGQMVTSVTPESCINFDFGGEKFPRKGYQKLCQNKKQVTYISHYDRDHFNFLYKVKSLNHCLALKNRPKTLRLGIPLCKESILKKVSSFKNQGASKNNSGFLLYYKGFYFPGDADTRFEGWSFKAKQAHEVKFLMLAHHGSNTSNGEKLFSSFKNLKMVFASARKNKYGHPHWQVLHRIKQKKIPLIRTETWGHIALPH